MNRNQHKQKVKRKVLKVSRALFLEKGYAKTTIKEITQGAGITTGSLYHFFKGKQEILLHLTQEVFDSAAVFADLMLKKEAEPWLRFSLEIGIQIYVVQKYPTIAELYLAAHESEETIRAIVRSAQIRNQRLFQNSKSEFTSDYFYAAALAIKGIFHSFIQEAVYNRQNTSTTLISQAIKMMLVLFNIPDDDIEKAIRTTHSTISQIPPAVLNSLVSTPK